MGAKALRDSYLRLHCRCQVSLVLSRYMRLKRHVHNELCVHHIWGRGKYGEHWANYLTVHPSAHDWIHATPPAGTIVCMWVKWRVGPWDVEVLNQASGKRVLGWVENKLSEVPAWCRRMGEELVKGASDGQ